MWLESEKEQQNLLLPPRRICAVQTSAPEKLSESSVPAHNCGDSAARRKSVAPRTPQSPANSNKGSTSHQEQMQTHYFTKDICTFAGGLNNLWIIPTQYKINYSSNPP